MLRSPRSADPDVVDVEPPHRLEITAWMSTTSATGPIHRRPTGRSSSVALPPAQKNFCPQAIDAVQLTARALHPRQRDMVEFLKFPARSVVAEGPDILTARA